MSHHIRGISILGSLYAHRVVEYIFGKVLLEKAKHTTNFVQCIDSKRDQQIIYFRLLCCNYAKLGLSESEWTNESFWMEEWVSEWMTTATTMTTTTNKFPNYKQNRLDDALKIDFATYCFVIFMIFSYAFSLSLSRSHSFAFTHSLHWHHLPWHQTFDNVSVNMESDDRVLLYESVRSGTAATRFHTPSFLSL